MRKALLICLAALAAFCACKRTGVPPRPTIPLVLHVASDTAGLREVAATAGHLGPAGAIALIGEPSDGILLARRFQHTDWVDNISGEGQRDSLPDFSGEEFQVILDVQNAPYGHFLSDRPAPEEDGRDSLREVAVKNALFAWDSTCVEHPSARPQTLKKGRSKILIYTSPYQARFGLFDVDTLQQLTGGCSRILSPVSVMLEDAVKAGARNIAVWAARPLRLSGAYEQVFEEMGVEGKVTVLTPDAALDVRTELRSLLRQYRATGESLDALLITDYAVNLAPLRSEIALIRASSADEDRAFSRMLSQDFVLLDPCQSLIEATYRLLRQENLFTHRIALPAVKYYETAESLTGETVLVEVSARYVQTAYVSDFD